MKLTHRIHVCLIVFLIHYFDIFEFEFEFVNGGRVLSAKGNIGSKS